MLWPIFICNSSSLKTVTGDEASDFLVGIAAVTITSSSSFIGASLAKAREEGINKNKAAFFFHGG